MSPQLIAVVAAGCVLISLALFVVAFRSSGRTRGQEVLLRATRGAQVKRVVDADSSARRRLIDPVLDALLRLGRRLTPPERLAKLELRLDRAGSPQGWDLNRIVAVKAICLLFGLGLGLLLSMSVLPPLLGVLAVVGLAVLGFYAPDIYLNQVAFHRNEALGRDLADTVDMLKLTLEAGIGFDSAVRLVAQNTDGPISAEFARVMQEITMGKSRSEALRGMGERSSNEDVKRFCSTSIQAEKRGTPFGEILTVQASEIRIKRRQLAEEKAQKVPIKILFPMMICVLPVLGIVVMGPAVVQMVLGMGK